MNRHIELDISGLFVGDVANPKQLCEMTGYPYSGNTVQAINALGKYMLLEKVGRGQYKVAEIYDGRISVAKKEKPVKRPMGRPRKDTRVYDEIFRDQGYYIRPMADLIVHECLCNENKSFVIPDYMLPVFFGMVKGKIDEKDIREPELVKIPFYISRICNDIIKNSLFEGVIERNKILYTKDVYYYSCVVKDKTQVSDMSVSTIAEANRVNTILTDIISKMGFNNSANIFFPSKANEAKAKKAIEAYNDKVFEELGWRSFYKAHQYILYPDIEIGDTEFNVIQSKKTINNLAVNRIYKYLDKRIRKYSGYDPDEKLAFGTNDGELCKHHYEVYMKEIDRLIDTYIRLK